MIDIVAARSAIHGHYFYCIDYYRRTWYWHSKAGWVIACPTFFKEIGSNMPPEIAPELVEDYEGHYRNPKSTDGSRFLPTSFCS